MDTYFGEIAALTAALSFSLTSVFFTLAGRKIDVITSLATSLPISLLILLPIHWLTEGEFFPVSAGLDRWLSLATSGILAFVVSSFFVLHAYQTLGPRLTMLIASIAPVLGAILALFLAWAGLARKLDLGHRFGDLRYRLGRCRRQWQGNRFWQEPVYAAGLSSPFSAPWRRDRPLCFLHKGSRMVSRP